MIDSVHTQFITAVATGRNMDKDQVRALADGRIFSGEQAKVAGLVDALGGLEDAVKTAASRGGITGEPRTTHARSSREPWWWRLLFNFTPTVPFSFERAFGLQIVYDGPFLR
jgi:ClpP class serine protease